MKKEFIPILLGSDDNVYGFSRSFNELYSVKPIALTTRVLEPTRQSKILDIIVDSRMHEEKHLCEFLCNLGKKLKKEYDKLILIPCSDSYMEMIVKIRDKLTDYENEFISFERLREFNDKESFYKMCEKYKLLYPKTYVCSKDNYEKIVKIIDLDYPLILKPNNSNSSEYLEATFDGKEKVYFINSKDELLNKINLIYSSTYKDTLIIQKYVCGDDTNMRVLNTYSDKSGKVKMMCLGQPILEEYHPNTYGNYAAIISLKKHIQLMDDIKNFLESINYKGSANFDIKMDSQTGKYYLFEINPRPGRSSFFTFYAGCSFAKCYIEDLVYDNLNEMIDAKQEILWLNVPMNLVKKYVKNEEILNKVNKLKEKKVYHTLIYKKDYSFKRRLLILKHYARKMNYYPKYYIEKK